ncbi:kinase-like domain-containing protein [Mycena capillaripes]|nr:kinase-like domain-containing protein [Mycena capillaripes]
MTISKLSLFSTKVASMFRKKPVRSKPASSQTDAAPKESFYVPQPSSPTPSLEDFDLIKPIGQGSTANVLLVRHKETGRLYSLKVVSKSGRYEEVMREQEVLKVVTDKTPFLLTVVASWHDSENYFLLTPFCPGGDLEALLKSSGPLAPERVRVAQMLLALETLHDLGIVHRDVKPANVFVDAEGNAMLGDLGLASTPHTREPFFVHFEADPEATEGSFRWEEEVTTTERCGTPAFRPTEQHYGREYGCEADVWALGVTSFEMITCRSPFASNPQTPEDCALAADWEPVHFKASDNLDEDVQGLVAAMLTKDRLLRPTVKDLKKHLFFASTYASHLSHHTSE